MSLKANDLINEKTDAEGFLKPGNAWNEAIANAIANTENLTLAADHWVVVHFLRNYYEQYSLAPPLRVMINKLAEIWCPEKANSIYLHQLFPDGPLKQASKIAGLPKPSKCL